MATADLLVIGGGIVGIAAALEARRRHHGLHVVLLEKEDDVARHASGRNSGVLHAGLYYKPGGLKARFARDGCARMTAYCLERGLPINRCGKIIVATNDREDAVLAELLSRGQANGVNLQMVDEAAARELDSAARVQGRALWVPATASVDPVALTRSLANDARAAGVDVRTGEAFLSSADGVVVTTGGRWSAGYVLNTAGAHADTIARQFGFGDGYRIIPFRGRYLQATDDIGIRRHVYPVPDLRNPFLGVHVTIAVDGKVWIGPTATPVLGREQYGAAVGVGEFASGAVGIARLLTAPGNAGIRCLAGMEIRRRSRRALLREGARLARGLPPSRAWTAGRPGIRAQLVDTRTWRLEDDFVYQADDRSLHVLNAVSPAFTSALPLAEHLVEIIEARWA